MNELLIVAVSALAGGIGIAAAILTYRSCSPPAPTASDAQRQDALERFKLWVDFWKYFLVSFALVLITTLLGNILKERELALQKSKQETELALENAKQTSSSLMAENTNLGNFLSNALADSWQKQYAFASYFSHVTRDDQARTRWQTYADFIKTTQQETPKLEAEKAKADTDLAKLGPSDPKRVELEVKRDEAQSKLDLNKAILQTPIKLSIGGVNLVDGGTLFEAGMTICVDGSPHAYHPTDSNLGLDVLGNAGRPGNWFGILTDKNGNPVIQTNSDPAPGFYVSFTSLEDLSKERNDPLRYVNSEIIPYITVPSKVRAVAGIKMGDFAVVLNTRNQKLQYAIVANTGSNMFVGEGSLALAKAIGVPVIRHPTYVSVDSGIIYKIFPGSTLGWPKTLDEINSEGERLLKAWGGQQRLLSELAGRSTFSQPNKSNLEK
jgi:hypothetical protein